MAFGSGGWAHADCLAPRAKPRVRALLQTLRQVDVDCARISATSNDTYHRFLERNGIGLNRIWKNVTRLPVHPADTSIASRVLRAFSARQEQGVRQGRYLRRILSLSHDHDEASTPATGDTCIVEQCICVYTRFKVIEQLVSELEHVAGHTYLQKRKHAEFEVLARRPTTPGAGAAPECDTDTELSADDDSDSDWELETNAQKRARPARNVPTSSIKTLLQTCTKLGKTWFTAGDLDNVLDGVHETRDVLEGAVDKNLLHTIYNGTEKEYCVTQLAHAGLVLTSM